MLGKKATDTLMDPNIHFDQLGEPLANPGQYIKLIGKLIYMTMTCPEISFAVEMLSRFMQSPLSTSAPWDSCMSSFFISQRFPGKGLFYRSSPQILRATLMLIGPVFLWIGDLFEVTAPLFLLIWLHGEARDKLLSSYCSYNM